MASGSSWGSSTGTTGAKSRRDAYNALPTNAKSVENMNEAQLDREIAKTKEKINRLDSSMNKNLEQSGYSRSLQEAFPLGTGGDGWSKSGIRRQEREQSASLKKAVAFTKARTEKKAAENHLKELQRAKKQVSGTGKTQSQLSKEIKAAAVKSSTALKWKTTNKGGYSSDGGYTSKEISAGNFKIRGSGGLYRVYEGSKQIGGASKLSDAKAFVEIWRKRK